MRLIVAIVALFALLVPAAAQNKSAPVDVQQLMMPGPLGDKGLGDPKAPVTVIEYASMTCPHCQRFHSESYPGLKANYIDKGKVYFILREFPLDALAYAAFMVARCSGDHYFDVIDTLFDHQEDWAFVQNPVDNLVALTEPFGIGMKEFEACIARDDVFDHIDNVATRGADLFHVDGTPTFFFNGQRAVGELSPDMVDKLVAAAPPAVAN